MQNENRVIDTLKYKDLKSQLKRIHKIKALTSRIKYKAGRSYGAIVSPRRGSFCRSILRFIDFKRIIFPKQYGLILKLGYDPMRSAPIALICYPSGLLLNILAPIKMREGNVIQNLSLNPRTNGDSSYLRNIPSGSIIHNVSLYPKGLGQLTRSAGCSTILVRKEHNHALLKLKSGELRFFHTSVVATMGAVGGETHFVTNLVKAGVNRLLGKRPRTRPSAMNPVDHPMGGRTRGGWQPTNPKGLITTHRPTKNFNHPAILYTAREMKFRRF